MNSLNYIKSSSVTTALVLEKFPYLYKCKEWSRGDFSLISKQQKRVETLNHHEFRAVRELSLTILSQVLPKYNSLPKLIKSSAVAKYSYEMFIHMNHFNCLYLYFGEPLSFNHIIIFWLLIALIVLIPLQPWVSLCVVQTSYAIFISLKLSALLSWLSQSQPGAVQQ